MRGGGPARPAGGLGNYTYAYKISGIVPLNGTTSIFMSVNPVSLSAVVSTKAGGLVALVQPYRY